jgi:hypothetical protein
MPISSVKRRAGLVVATAFVAAAALYAWAGPKDAADWPVLTAAHPVDVAHGAAGTPVLGDHAAYDLFSWMSFVALNSSPDGTVLGKTGDNETLWSSWMEDFQVLVTDGQTPPPWGTPMQVPAACKAVSGAQDVSRVISHTAKMHGVVGLFDQAQAGPLIDRNGAYVRYEILINAPMYDYIRDNGLYTQAGLNAFGQIDFPAGSLDTGQIGAIMVKAAWKVLGVGDDPTRFHVSRAYVVDEQANTCAPELLGLVGFHISTKTKSAPQWIWSTFEHVDNAPDKGEARPGGHYNFYDADCASRQPTSSCVPNALPETPWNPQNPGQYSVQVERVTPIDPQTAAMTASFQQALRDVNPNSVWANYMLVGTQYPQRPTDPTDPQGRPFPPYLANTTIETFLQGDTPPVSSSCIACHNRATATASAKPSDFTYILSRVTAKD